MEDLLSAARNGDGLIEPLAARVLSIAFGMDRLACAAEMVDGVDVIDIQRTKIDDIHRMDLHSLMILEYPLCTAVVKSYGHQGSQTGAFAHRTRLTSRP